MTPEPSVPQRLRGIFRNQRLHKRAIGFALVGVVNTVVDFSTFVVGYYQLGLNLVLANVAAWCVAVSCSYFLNSTFTFAAESGRVLRLRDYGKFLASNLAGLAANTTTVVVASLFVPVLVGKALAIAVSFAVNFSLSYLLVFPRQPLAPAVHDQETEPSRRA